MVVILFAKERFYRYRCSHNKNEWGEQKIKTETSPNRGSDNHYFVSCGIFAPRFV